VSAELSFSPNTPAQRNTDDLVNAMLGFVGPLGVNAAIAAAGGPGSYLPGYDEFHKTQFQVNTVKIFNNLLGADASTLIGEVGFQWNNVPDSATGIRYGRAAVFGMGSTPILAAQDPVTQGSTCLSQLAVAPGVSVPNPLFNPSANGCNNNGFVTDFAWGYRVNWSMDYSNVLNSGVTVTPSVFWSQDIQGNSIDGQFLENRRELAVGVKFTYAHNYNVALTYATYGNAAYDPLHDRDFYSVTAGVTF